jgi:hypothetical protein
VHEDDALCLALTCRALRDALWERFPRQYHPLSVWTETPEALPRSLHGGRDPTWHYSGRMVDTRLRTRDAAVTTSLNRFMWIRALPPGGVRNMKQGLRGGPTYGGDSLMWNKPAWLVDQYMLREGVPDTRTASAIVCARIAATGSLGVLQWARGTGGCRWWDSDVCNRAAFGGHLTVMRWVTSVGCEIDAGTCAAAAAGGQLEALKWLRQNDCEWDQSTCEAAAAAADWTHGGTQPGEDNSRFLEVLRWARDNGCDWDEWRPSQFTLLQTPIENGDLDTLIWLENQGCPWDEDEPNEDLLGSCGLAAQAGHLEVLKWLRTTMDAPWTFQTCLVAARTGRLDILRWAHANGCPWNSDHDVVKQTCAYAAKAGHMELLRWARANGCPWTMGSMFKYVPEYNGNFVDVLYGWEGGDRRESASNKTEPEVLRWARAQGCDWDSEMCTQVVRRLGLEPEGLELLQWARTSGCMWDRDECRLAAERLGTRRLGPHSWGPFVGSELQALCKAEIAAWIDGQIA